MLCKRRTGMSGTLRLRGMRADWVCRNEQGAEVGERFDPLRRVGIYVPAGTAPLVSTAIMTVSLARAAGVSEYCRHFPGRFR